MSPYVLVADDAFQPILSVLSPIYLNPEKVENITMACCALHNFLRSHTEVYMPPGSVDQEDPVSHTVQPGDWHEGPQPSGLAFL